MEEILKSIGWEELYSETINRIMYFRNAFREVFNDNEITDEELDKCICYEFGVYGQDQVYNMYSTAKNGIDKPLADVIREFIAVTNNVIDVDYNLTPKSYIYLFLEYTFSIVIKK